MGKFTAERILLCFFALLFTLTGNAFGEVHFKGDMSSEVNFNLPGEDYDSPLNPGNALEMKDLMFRNDINLKLDEAGETAALDLWVQLKQYPLGDLITGTAAILRPNDKEASASIALLSQSEGGYLYSLDILRANASWIPGDRSRFTAGRQSYLTGYGYGWNPADLANPPKNPSDPEAALQGVDGLTLQQELFPWMSIKVHGLFPREEGLEYHEVMAGGELTLQITALEIKISGLYGGEEGDNDDYDPYPHAGAAAFYADIFGLGVYGEGVIRSRSRRNVPSGGQLIMNNKRTCSALAGTEYYFNSGLVLAMEYFYNGEGWDKEERSSYGDILEASGELGTLQYGSFFSPLYFSRHYILANLMIPWYAIDSSFNLNCIFSPDSRNLFLTPGFSINLNQEGSLTSDIRYSGILSLDENNKGEAWFSPVNHSIMVNIKYYF